MPLASFSQRPPPSFMNWAPSGCGHRRLSGLGRHLSGTLTPLKGNRRGGETEQSASGRLEHCLPGGALRAGSRTQEIAAPVAPRGCAVYGGTRDTGVSLSAE